MFKSLRNGSKPTTNWPSIMEQCRKNTKDSRLAAFYSSSQFESALPIEKVHFVALDFETTGLDPIRDDIVSIGLVPFDLRRVYCKQGFHWLTCPRQPLTESSVVIHGITHSEVREAPDLLAILEDLLAALSGKMIVVHYSPIERQFFNSALLARLGEGIRFPVIDTMNIEVWLNRKCVKKFWNRKKREKPGWLRLGACRERYSLPAYQAHHALADAIATAELFQAQVAHHYSARTRLAELIV